MRSPLSRTRLIGLGAGVVVAVAAGVVVLFAVRDGQGSPSRAPEPRGRYAEAYAGLCTARSAARSGDVVEARRAFLDRSHQPLHELAAQATERDRAVAARLLEAKEAVEASLGRSSPTAAADLDGLVDATGAALVATGRTRPPPCR